MSDAAATTTLAQDVQELEQLYPAHVGVPIPGQKPVVVLPLNVRQVAKVGKALRRIMDDDRSGDMDVLQLLTEFPDEVITIIAAAVDRDVAWFEELRADTALKVAVAVFEVNVPFFAVEVGPLIAKLTSTMQAIAALAGGQDNSSGSGTTDTNGQKSTL